jgi:hypothetical protein
VDAATPQARATSVMVGAFEVRLPGTSLTSRQQSARLRQIWQKLWQAIVAQFGRALDVQARDHAGVMNSGSDMAAGSR